MSDPPAAADAYADAAIPGLPLEIALIILERVLGRRPGRRARSNVLHFALAIRACSEIALPLLSRDLWLEFMSAAALGAVARDPARYTRVSRITWNKGGNQVEMNADYWDALLELFRRCAATVKAIEFQIVPRVGLDAVWAVLGTLGAPEVEELGVGDTHVEELFAFGPRPLSETMPNLRKINVLGFGFNRLMRHFEQLPNLEAVSCPQGASFSRCPRLATRITELGITTEYLVDFAHIQDIRIQHLRLSLSDPPKLFSYHLPILATMSITESLSLRDVPPSDAVAMLRVLRPGIPRIRIQISWRHRMITDMQQEAIAAALERLGQGTVLEVSLRAANQSLHPETTNMIRLVSFDAFGTLFSPRGSVGAQYLAAARTHLPPSLLAPLAALPSPESRLDASFSAARAAFSRSHPNFGRGSLGVRGWWEAVIGDAFARAGVDLARDPAGREAVIAELYDGFARDPGRYTVYPDALPALDALRALPSRPIICCTSNMDDRLGAVLRTLGISADFALGSYEMGAEKPDPRVWERVRGEASGMVKEGEGMAPGECLHVGDDLEKDYESATKAGWHALLLKRGKPIDGPGQISSLSQVVDYVLKLNNA
ncbi:HAD-like domain-containing protein [Hyaloraphidium curvatum]|nr:HAD-like domain-containing protein [Hyaloraphidium curvatum]